MPRASPQQPCLRDAGLNTILVFRALQVGDMLCAVPALRALRNACPSARIILVGLPWAAQLPGRFPHLIDAFIPFPGHPRLPEQGADAVSIRAFYRQVRALHADLAIQLHGSGEFSNAIARRLGAKKTTGFTRHPEMNPGFLRYPEQGHEIERLCALMRALGSTADDTSLEFPLLADDHAELNAAGVPLSVAGDDYVCLHPGARDPRRRWPAARFAAVGDHLARAFGVKVVLTGSGAERELAAEVAAQMNEPAINAAQPISLGAMAALIDGARLLVCNDTGASHIAAALRVPSVVVFGHADVGRWAPLDRQRHRCVRDPDGQKTDEVIAHASALMRESFTQQAGL